MESDRQITPRRTSGIGELELDGILILDSDSDGTDDDHHAIGLRQ